jgi:ribosomal protein L40E
MTQILTESFCERCGTRYTFETVAPRRGGVTQLKVLSKGIRNFVMSDSTTIEDAFADAKGDVDRIASTQQLEAFHKTFNFCLDCRQYTCGNCWNETENRCLSCKPDLSREPLPAPFPDLAPIEPVAAAPESEDRAALLAAMAWPETDLRARSSVAAAAESEALAEAEASDVGGEVVVAETGETAAAFEVAAPEPAAAAVVPAPAEAEAASPAAVAPVAAEAGTDDRAVAASAATLALLGRYRPGQSLDDEIAAYERETEGEPEPIGVEAATLAEAATEPTKPAEPVVAEAILMAAAAEVVESAVETEPAAEVEVAPVAAEEPTPAEPVAAEEPETDAPQAVDRVEQPVWVRTPPVAPTEAPAPPAPAVPPAPQWPAAPSGEAPQWPTSAAFLPVADPTSTRVRDAMWAASNVEVAQVPSGVARAAGVQSCASCGLSLSANARFCRRCGTRQG